MQAPAKKSLSALAASARKSSSSSAPSLASLAAAKNKAPSDAINKPTLSKLASKAQTASSTATRRPLSSLASSVPIEASQDAPMTTLEQSDPAKSESKLSKLQQRLQRGAAVTRAGPSSSEHAAEEQVPEAANVWQLPSSRLFQTNNQKLTHPSSFAGVLAPSHMPHTGPEPEDITTRAINAGFEKLPTLPSSQNHQQSKMAEAGRHVTPLRK